MKSKDSIIGLVFALFSIFGITYIRSQEYISTLGLSRGVFPLLALVIIGICGLLILVKALRKPQNAQARMKIEWTSPEVIKLLLIMLILFVYVWLFKSIGFIITTIVFMVASMFLYGERRLVYLISIPIGTTVFIYLLFTKAFYIMLP